MRHPYAGKMEYERFTRFCVVEDVTNFVNGFFVAARALVLRGGGGRAVAGVSPTGPKTAPHERTPAQRTYAS